MFSATTSQQDMHPSLLVSIKKKSVAEESPNAPLRITKTCLLLFSPVSQTEGFLVDSLRELAGKIAVEDSTSKLGAIRDREGPEYRTALDKVRVRMKAVAEVFGPGMKEHMWATTLTFSTSTAAVKVGQMAPENSVRVIQSAWTRAAAPSCRRP